MEETLKEVMRATRENIRINTFMLDESPYLQSFVEKMMQMNRGRASDRVGERHVAGAIRVEQPGHAERRVAPTKPSSVPFGASNDYAKVDRDLLLEIAMPWPGVA